MNIQNIHLYTFLHKINFNKFRYINGQLKFPEKSPPTTQHKIRLQRSRMSSHLWLCISHIVLDSSAVAAAGGRNFNEIPWITSETSSFKFVKLLLFSGDSPIPHVSCFSWIRWVVRRWWFTCKCDTLYFVSDARWNKSLYPGCHFSPPRSDPSTYYPCCLSAPQPCSEIMSYSSSGCFVVILLLLLLADSSLSATTRIVLRK